jgi:ribosomal protein S6
MSEDTQDTELATPTGLFEADEVKDQEAAPYEIGYHLLPTLSEDESVKATQDIAEFLKKNGGEVFADHAAEKIELAYAIQKRVGGKPTNFNEAYFGWVAFDAVPSAVAAIKTYLDTNPLILRYLLVSTTKEEVKAVMEGAVIMPTAHASTEAIAAPKRDVEAGAIVSEEALTEALDTMAKEDEK